MFTQTRFLLPILCVLALLAGSCASPPPPSGTRYAVWEMAPDENLAVPHCPECHLVADRARQSCERCGTFYAIAKKQVDCPECRGTAACAHCDRPGTCIPCNGSGKCGICEGSGEFEGALCPECDGAKGCTECARSGVAYACEFCEDSKVCANCSGSGLITLR